MATQTHQTSVDPMWLDLRRRSKGGCIDCKIAKVRCDEIRPSCGTCARRQRRCRGYPPLANAGPHSKERQQRFISYVPTNARRKRTLENSNARLDAQTPTSPAASIETIAEERDRSLSVSSAISVQREIEPASNQLEVPGLPVSTATGLTISCESIPSLPPISRSIPTIPPGTIPADDAETISVYFNRHPFEQVISLEFVDEMNASVLVVLQDSPQAVGDALCSIGSVYLEEDSQGSLLPLALVRRARTLATLKAKDPSRELEQMLLMSLALGAMEGIDTRCKPHERTSSILIAYAASIINKYIGSGLVLSSLAKYFIRALARHDMVMSLSRLRRNSIKTETWLDETANSPDRFMGYTTTLMPLLEELCGLAEDIRHNAEPGRAITYGPEDATSILPSITRKVNNLRSRIQSWRWVFDHSVSAKPSGRLMAHAHAYRAAALLMLFRLLHPAGSSVESDREAFEMACEVMVHLKGPPEELRLSTWPALIASCELESEEDRAVAINVFRSIYSVRKTGTSLQTMKFVMERVWRARNEGHDWDWMTLSQKFTGECVPI
ncbi:uncharacterized protein Z518_02105 [Rhinocladiella mackenziei CBS 650.93]|uniref:Rhinocladiella mackenziei CBS 650.93 unplaced genomic scaffold supercont1.2, whole genome shotgun sequence n=1 Tax=Rhinocladiella mackenziei CBS 650.93 TaxID=1442369 RepID=A0A0D2FYU8_9EURO|nr:uncharacterized protein Z518_02105 [Rhinocladiella mackenziei CBS 650.93]KIX07452.1 hypothetical protein Z518_02105 [Rhinocladiella mackenziei CBS 650.93]